MSCQCRYRAESRGGQATSGRAGWWWCCRRPGAPPTSSPGRRRLWKVLSWRERNITTRTLPQVSVGPFLCGHEIESDEYGEGDHGYGQEADVGGDPGGGWGVGEAVEGRDGALGHLLLPALTGLGVRGPARRTEGRGETDTGTPRVVPLSQGVQRAPVLGGPRTGGAAATTPSLAPHLPGPAVTRALLATAPAGTFVLLQLYLATDLLTLKHCSVSLATTLVSKYTEGNNHPRCWVVVCDKYCR